MNFMQLPLTSTPFMSKYLPQLHIIKNPSPSSPLNVKYRVSHPYKTKDNFIVSPILIFNFVAEYYSIRPNIPKWNMAHVPGIIKGKAIHVQILKGPVSSTRLRLPDIKTICSPMHRPSLYITCWFDHRTIVPPEELSQWKIPMEESNPRPSGS
jgi:hypothetical protein